MSMSTAPCRQSRPARSCRAMRVPGWRVLRALGAQLGLAGFEFTELARVALRVAGRACGKIHTAANCQSAQCLAPDADSGLIRVATVPIYRSDAVVAPFAGAAGASADRQGRGRPESGRRAGARPRARRAGEGQCGRRRKCMLPVESSRAPCRAARPGSNRPGPRPARCRRPARADGDEGLSVQLDPAFSTSLHDLLLGLGAIGSGGLARRSASSRSRCR